MNGFETILPFLKPIEHLIVDDSISVVILEGQEASLLPKRSSDPRT